GGGPLVGPYTAAANITVATSKNWSAISPAPTAADTVTIGSGATLTVDVSNAVAGIVKASDNSGSNGSAGTLTFNSGSQLTVTDLTVGGSKSAELGTVDMSSGGTAKVSGAFTLTASKSTFTAGTGTFEYNG